jgi:hypothetical protein
MIRNSLHEIFKFKLKIVFHSNDAPLFLRICICCDTL